MELVTKLGARLVVAVMAVSAAGLCASVVMAARWHATGWPDISAVHGVVVGIGHFTAFCVGLFGCIFWDEVLSAAVPAKRGPKEF